MNIYRYIITADTGMAPAIDRGLVTLATCKPVIRRCSAVGDWVVACRASPSPLGLVAWAGRVVRKLPIGQYEREFRGRSDAVYRESSDGTLKALRRDYHQDTQQQSRDKCNPALLFDMGSTWYFGDRPKLLPANLMHLAPRGQGHRVNGVGPDDAAALLAWLRAIGAPGVYGQPPDAEDDCGDCAARPKAKPLVC